MIDTKHCDGCRDDFYNGKNDIGVHRCWNADDATMAKGRDIPVDLPPPYKHLPITNRPSCYKKPRHVRAKVESLDERGYWK